MKYLCDLSAFHRLADALFADQGYKKQRKHHRNGIAKDHRDGTDRHHLVCSVYIIHVRNEYENHMEDFSCTADDKAVKARGFFVVKHKFATSCTEKSGKNAANRAGKLTERARPEISGKPTVNTADHAGDYSGRSAE